jgi:DNA-directed RNA polymerase specialized sigma24 family protein
MSQRSEEERRKLLLKAQAGDERALDELCRSFVEYVFAVCRAKLQNVEDAEDATNKTLARLALYYTAIDPRRPITPYVGTIARSICARHFAENSKAPDHEVLDSDLLAGEDSNPEAGVVKRAEIEHGLSLLSESEALLLRLHYMLEIPVKELPNHWPADLPHPGNEGCIRRSLKRALFRLKLHLQRLRELEKQNTRENEKARSPGMAFLLKAWKVLPGGQSDEC